MQYMWHVKAIQDLNPLEELNSHTQISILNVVSLKCLCDMDLMMTCM